MEERGPYKAEVTGSSPVPPTIQPHQERIPRVRLRAQSTVYLFIFFILGW